MYHIYATRYCRLYLLQGWIRAPCLTSQWTNNEVTDDDEVTKEATKDVNMMVHCNPVADVKDETISASDTLRLIVYGNDWNEMIWTGR